VIFPGSVLLEMRLWSRAMYRAQYGRSLIGRPEAIIEALIRSSVMPLARSATPLREASYGGEVINLIPSESKYSRLRACISSLALSQRFR
jgi:hypothetical protein